ncbi:MAG: cytochrome c biogenesis protein CcdA [Hyphomicrobiales bacterium]|nr:cytochrome c biogenesis protein CcdA [Hyphomicrobiales bacterium]
MFFALAAGALSALSPCVLPLLPIVFGTALGQHRWGAAALALGLAVSFTAAGLFIATIGFALNIDADVFRAAGAIVLIGLGMVLVVPAFQSRVALAASGVSNWGNQQTQAIEGRGLWGQFGLGFLLGAVWSPCVGPTLGAASLLAARGENLWEVGLTMLAFGVGVVIPLLLIASISRAALMRWRGAIMGSAKRGKIILGAILLVTGIAVLTGWDKQVEAAILNIMPQWLSDLTVVL